ncbi:MAG: putative toxin-antitoxin system toxin component, PIN family [Rhodoferax sp.]|nr:putative toxin-antitoxin system toxin component, PIN family [Rhodoferax sp.]
MKAKWIVNTNPFKVVIDTNVWISGLLTRTGTVALLTRHVVQMGQAVFSAQTFAELKDRVWRPKFDRYVTLEQRKKFLSDMESNALWVEVPPALSATAYCRDAADDMFIHTAQAAHAAWLVTGDDDLLCLHPVGSLQILSPRTVLDVWKIP